MIQFDNLKDLHQHLEDNIINYRHSSEIRTLFDQLRELKLKGEQMEEATKAQWETYTFYVPLSSTKDIMIKNLKVFVNEAYDYLINREEEVKNPILKARYSHILWMSPRKHINYGTHSTDAYLDLVRIYEQKDKDDIEQEHHFGLKVLGSIKNAFQIAQFINYRSSEVKSELIRLVKDFNINSSSSYVMRMQLIELMLNNKKMFDKNDFEGIDKICEDLAEDYSKTSLDRGIDILEIGEKVDIRLGNKNDNWKRKIASINESISIDKEDGSNLMAMDYCKKAIGIYKELKDTIKVEELEKRLKHLKDSMKLNEIRYQYDITELMNHFRKEADEISNKTPKVIIQYLMYGPLLPNEDALKLFIEENHENSFMDVIPIQLFDNAGNVAQYFVEQEETEYYKLLFNYNHHLKLNALKINEIFSMSIRKGNLSSKDIIDYLSIHSWFGKSIAKRSERIHNWLNVISPSISEYFNQIELSQKNHEYEPNFVLAIDSLSLKIEGLLRDICDIYGVKTFYITKDKKNRDISREKDIHALLYEERVINLLNKNDLLFLRFLLVEKAGYNLRHKVAHALMQKDEYSSTKIQLLIIAILKLGKYNYKEETNSRDKHE